MNKIIWKLLFILLLFITITLSFSIEGWVNEKVFHPEEIYWIGIVLGTLEGIVSVELKNAYKNQEVNR
jgi:hypothetical protein